MMIATMLDFGGFDFCPIWPGCFGLANTWHVFTQWRFSCYKRGNACSSSYFSESGCSASTNCVTVVMRRAGQDQA